MYVSDGNSQYRQSANSLRQVLSGLDPAVRAIIEEIETKNNAYSVSSFAQTSLSLHFLHFRFQVRVRNKGPGSGLRELALLSERGAESPEEQKESVDPMLKVTLRDYQKQSVKWLCEMETVFVHFYCGFLVFVFLCL